jgi:hypothetical protein
MGKTYKTEPYHLFRSPKGYKQALINKARKIPSQSWDDILPSPEVRLPYKAAVRLLRKGLPHEEIIQIIAGKFHYLPACSTDR